MKFPSVVVLTIAAALSSCSRKPENVAGAGAAKSTAMEDALALIEPLPEVSAALNGRLAMIKLPSPVRRSESKGKALITYPGERPGLDKPAGVNGALLAEYRQENTELIAAFRHILQMPAWQRLRAEEKVTDFMGAESFDNRLVLPANVVLAEAMVQALNGRPEHAWPDILAVMQLGRRMVLSRGTMMDILTGKTLFDRAVQTAAGAGRYAPDAATARRLAAALQPLEDCSDFYLPAMEGWFYYHLRGTEVFRSGGDTVKKMLVDMYAGLETTHFELNQVLNDVVKNKGEGNSTAANLTASDRGKAQEEKVSRYMSDPPGHVAKHMAYFAKTDWEEKLRAETEAFRRARQLRITTFADCRKEYPLPDKEAAELETEADKTARMYYGIVIESTARTRMARVSLLLLAWKLNHGGKSPPSLDALVPDYLPAVPVDPFDGKSLRYNPNALWCTGPDLTDDGGSHRDEKDRVQEL